jgi:hypothetical protein
MVKYYDEKVMADIRQTLEKTIMLWHDVTKRMMFGCPSYATNGNIFAVLLTNGVGITRLMDEDKELIAGKFPSEPFAAGGRVIKKWIVVRVDNAADLKQLTPWIEKSYRSAVRGD